MSFSFLFYLVVFVVLFFVQYYNYKKKAERIKTMMEYEVAEILPEYRKGLVKIIVPMMLVMIGVGGAITLICVRNQVEPQTTGLVFGFVAVVMSLVVAYFVNKEKKKYVVKKTIKLDEMLRDEFIERNKQAFVRTSVILGVVMLVVLMAEIPNMLRGE